MRRADSSPKAAVGRRRELWRATSTELPWGESNARDCRLMLTDNSGWASRYPHGPFGHHWPVASYAKYPVKLTLLGYSDNPSRQAWIILCSGGCTQETTRNCPKRWDNLSVPPLSAALTCIDQCIYWLIHRRFIVAKTATLALQKWGNSLAVRIPSAVAKSVGFKVGQPVEVSAQESAVLVTALGEPRLTLAQKLALFDPERHAGEAMATTPVGGEVL
jgi:antitoxin MazE